MGRRRLPKKQNKRKAEKRKFEIEKQVSMSEAFTSTAAPAKPSRFTRFLKPIQTVKVRVSSVIEKATDTVLGKRVMKIKARVTEVIRRLPRTAWIWIAILVSGAVLFTTSALTSGNFQSYDGYRVTYKSAPSREQIETKVREMSIDRLDVQFISYSELSDKVREFTLDSNAEQRQTLLTKIGEDTDTEEVVYIRFYGTNPLSLHFSDIIFGSLALALGSVLLLLSFGRGDSLRERLEFWLIAVVSIAASAICIAAAGVIATRISPLRFNPEIFNIYQLLLSLSILAAIYFGLTAERRKTVRRIFFAN